jgi:uncharacterized protein (TIGR03382 family)
MVMGKERAVAWLWVVVFFLPFLPAHGDEVHWTWQSTSRIQSAEPLSNGHVLISEKDLGRIIEVDPAFPSGGQILSEIPNLRFPDRTRRLASGNTLVADTGNERVLEIDPSGQTVWSFGSPGFVSCVDTSVGEPGDMERLPNGDTLIPDELQHRVFQVTPAGAISWYLGRSDCASGTGASELAVPFSVQALTGGDILLAEVGNHRVRRITPTPPVGGVVVWQYGQDGILGSGPNFLNQCNRAIPLENGNVLISDSGNHRVIEVTPTLPTGGTIVWQYGTTGVLGTGLNFLSAPYDAHRVANGATLIAERDNQRAQLVAPDGSPAQLVITSPPLQAAPLRRCLGPLVVQVQNLAGQPVSVTTTTLLSPSDSTASIAFFADAACETPVSSLAMLGGSSAATLYVVASQATLAQLTVRAPWLQPALQDASFQASLLLSVGCQCGSTKSGQAVVPALLLMTLFLLRRRFRGRSDT